MNIVEIKATEKIDECWGLLMQHRDELATYKDIMVLKPDIARYKAIEDEGNLISLALYDGSKIVGYSVTVITHAMHYEDLKIAMNDILFVRPDLRRGMWGYKLITETERLAREKLGVSSMITFHAKENTPLVNIMPRLGYRVQDIIFSKVL